MAMSIYMLVSGIIGPFIGYLTETYGPKKILTLFSLGTGAAFILVSFTQSLWYFYAAYALLSVMTTGIGFIPVSSILTRWFIRRRGTAIGIAMVGIATGGLVMAPLVGYINTHFSWRISFIFLGAMVWVLALPTTLLLIKENPGEIGAAPDGDDPAMIDVLSLNTEQQGWPLKAALRSKTFFWISVSFFMAPLAQMGILQHQVPMITESGISQAAAITALGFTAGIGGFGKLCFGRVSESIPIQYVIMVCFGMQALGILILLYTNSLTMLWFHVFIFGFGMGGIVVLLPLVVGHFFGLVSFGVIMGIIIFFEAIGGACGTYMSGFVYDSFGSYQYALFFYIFIYLTSIITFFMAGKPRIYSKT